jgi:hypothetical protein
MKKRILVLIFVAIGCLMATCGSMKLVLAQSDFSAFYGNPIADSQIDGTIGSEWNDAGSYTNVSINPWGIAHIWTKQDGTCLYIGMSFVADSNNPWVAFELGTSSCMSMNADGAVFGDDNYSPNGYEDIHFTENAGVASDASQDGKGAMSVNSSNFVIMELKKPLNSGDMSGKDINWTQGDTYSLVILWDSDSGGSSGGTTGHLSGTPSVKTILINSNPIPEFPNSIIIAGVVTTAISIVILRKRLLKTLAK